MKLTGKWTVANLLLLATIGCNSGEESAAPPAAGPAPEVTPVTPTTAKSDPAKAATPSDAAPTAPTTDASKKVDDGPKVEGPKAENSKSTHGPSLTEKQLAAIKQLPESEQAVALKQVVCPVGGGPLGAMGKPFKVTYEGRSLYLCCDGCEDEFKADPKAVIAKLDKK